MKEYTDPKDIEKIIPTIKCMKYHTVIGHTTDGHSYLIFRAGEITDPESKKVTLCSIIYSIGILDLIMKKAISCTPLLTYKNIIEINDYEE